MTLLLRKLLTMWNSKLARYPHFPFVSLLCRRAVTLSAAIQSVPVHCAAEQLHCQPPYKVSQSTVPQSSYTVSRDTKCLSPLCRRAVTCQPRYKVSQSTVPQSSYPVSRGTKFLSPLTFRLCLHSNSVTVSFCLCIIQLSLAECRFVSMKISKCRPREWHVCTM